LFNVAKRFVSRITDEAQANTISQDVRSRFDSAALTNVAYFEKAVN
jgi:hypothetical protein